MIKKYQGMNGKIIAVLIITYWLIINGCNSSATRGEEINNTIKSIVIELCDSLVSLDTYKQADSLVIRLNVKCELFDDVSAQVFASRIVSGLYLGSYRFSYYEVTIRYFSFYNDPITFYFDKSELIKIAELFKVNQTNHVIEVIFANYKQRDILVFDSLIDEMPSYISNYEFSGSYWGLVFEFIKNCQNRDLKKEFWYLAFIRTAIVDPEINKELFVPILESCHYDFNDIDSLTKGYLLNNK